MKIKICGVTNVYTAKKICEYGADYIGFVFAKSKRQVELGLAREISLAIGKNIKKVGVFVDESANEIIEIADYCELDYIQLHGSQRLEGYECKQKIIRSISVDVSIVEENNLVDKFEADVNSYDHILFDTKVGKIEGGSGRTFNWSKLDAINLYEKKCFLAGGLNIDNIGDAIRLTKPYAIDVSSGVESNGKKDVLKIKELIELIRSVENEL